MTIWTAVRQNGRQVISGIIAETVEAAQAEVERALRGRPGGRHDEWKKWNDDGRLVTEGKK